MCTSQNTCIWIAWSLTCWRRLSSARCRNIRKILHTCFSFRDIRIPSKYLSERYTEILEDRGILSKCESTVRKRHFLNSQTRQNLQRYILIYYSQNKPTCIVMENKEMKIISIYQLQSSFFFNRIQCLLEFNVPRTSILWKYACTMPFDLRKMHRNELKTKQKQTMIKQSNKIYYNIRYKSWYFLQEKKSPFFLPSPLISTDYNISQGTPSTEHALFSHLYFFFFGGGGGHVIICNCIVFTSSIFGGGGQMIIRDAEAGGESNTNNQTIVSFTSVYNISNACLSVNHQ